MSTPIEEIDALRYLGGTIGLGAAHWEAYTYAIAEAANATSLIPAAQEALLEYDAPIRAAEAALHTALEEVPTNLTAVFAASQALDTVFAEVRPAYEALAGTAAYAQEQTNVAATRLAAIEALLPDIRVAIRTAYAALPPEE